MGQLKSLIKHISHPGMAWMVSLILLSIAALVFTFNTNQEKSLFGYASYVLSAYSMTVFVIFIPSITSKIESFIQENKIIYRFKSFIYSNEHSSRFMKDIPFRIKISLYVSLSVNLIYTVLKLLAGMHYASFWYGADAVYYIILSAAQFILLRHVQKEDLEREYRLYRSCGYLLFALNAPLIGVIYQIIDNYRVYQYPGILIYVVATYAFICLAVSIANVVRYRKLKRPILSAVKTICLAKALVAIFALQTAMLTTFGVDGNETFKILMNSLTGGSVCIVIFIMAMSMVIQANKNLKNSYINNLET